VRESLPLLAEAYGETQLQRGARCGWVMVLSKGKVGTRKHGGEREILPFNLTVLLKPWCMYLKGDVPQLMDADEVDAHASGLLTLYTSKYDEPNTNHSLRCLVLRVIKTF